MPSARDHDLSRWTDVGMSAGVDLPTAKVTFWPDLDAVMTTDD